MPVDRLTRVNELLKREIAEALERRRPPELAGTLVSVTEVRCGSDLRNATVKVSVYGGEAGTVLRHLRRLRPEIQHGLAGALGFKHTPVLDFRIDDRLAAADRVLELLNEEPESPGEA